MPSASRGSVEPLPVPINARRRACVAHYGIEWRDRPQAGLAVPPARCRHGLAQRAEHKLIRMSGGTIARYDDSGLPVMEDVLYVPVEDGT